MTLSKYAFGWLPFETLVRWVGPRKRTDPNNVEHALSLRSCLLDAIGYYRDDPAAGVWEQRFRRADKTGWLKLADAEDYCHLLGVHPMRIWGDEYFRAAPTPEWEYRDTFGGRPVEWQSIGRDAWYGVF